MVDTRQYRSVQTDPATNVDDRWIPGRTMLGEAQDGQRSPKEVLDDYTRQFQVLAGQ